MASHQMTQADRKSLHAAARDLHTQFRGIFSEETIESLLHDSYAELDNPAGKTLEEIRPIRDEIRDRVANLIEKLSGNR